MGYILQFDEFLRSIAQNYNVKHSVLLGAGASVESGMPSAQECIWEWKCKIFVSNNPALATSHNDYKNDIVRRNVQNWIELQPDFPPKDSDEEYSFYAERANRIPGDRRKYFEDLSVGKEPSIGYHLLMLLAQKEMIKTVWTTNFDGLVVKTAHQHELTPIEITLESQDRIYRNEVEKELLCISLHGDYKYGELKNTDEELDSQSNIFTNALMYELNRRNLIVIGYSGRDYSLMNALKKSYSQPGAGRIYWCGYGKEISSKVKDLIECIRSNGREAYYVPTDGFDTTMLMLSRNLWIDDKTFQKNVSELANKLQKKLEERTVSFLNDHIKYTKLLQSNMYPVVFPKSCFKFKINYEENESEWNYCMALNQYNIIAVPFSGNVYAWGNKDTIFKMCRDRISGEIQICPIDRETVANNTVFKEMLSRTITCILARKENYCSRKNRIWNSKRKFEILVDKKTITAFEALEIDLFFEKNNTYIVLNPSYEYKDKTIVGHNENKEFSRLYMERLCNKRPNIYYFEKIEKWIEKLFLGSNFTATFPFENSNEVPFIFKFGQRCASIGIDSNNKILIPSDYDKKRVIFTGREIRDTDLMFYNVSQKQMKCDFHPMRGLINNNPFEDAYNAFGDKRNIQIAGIVPSKYCEVMIDFINLLNIQHKVKYNVDYVIDFPGFHKVFDVGVEIPNKASSMWINLELEKKGSVLQTAVNYANLINRKIEDLYMNGNVDVVLIFIPKEYEQYTLIRDGREKFDLHDYVKAYAVQRHIATQFIREKTILDTELRCQIMWALALAIFVKSGRIPWTLSNLRKDTAFAGIGYSTNYIENTGQMVIGCSHIYSADGQGLKYKLTKLTDVMFDEKRNPFLSEEEAFRLGIGIKDLFYSSFSEMPKRVVVHKRTPFKPDEINGLVKCLSSAGIKEIDLIEISFEEKLKCFSLDRSFAINGYPVKRGTCFAIDDNSAYLFTHGVATSVQKSYLNYVQGGKSMPNPIKIVKHYGNGDLSQIASEILGLSKMNWNSFGLYTKLPCTIESSRQIAKIGWLLSGYEGATYEYRHFM